MDSGRQQRSQSKDFGETCNLHTEMNVTDEHFHRIFHNWKEPAKCDQNRRGNPCWVCTQLKEKGYVDKNSEKISVKILVIGDLHGDIDGLLETINAGVYKAVLCVGDLGIYASTKNANANNKVYIKGTFTFIDDVPTLPIPLYSIKGNHDDCDLFESPELNKKNIFYLKQGEILKIDNLVIAGIGGIYSSKQSYDSYEGIRNPKFLHESEIRTLMATKEKIDVLLTHEAASGMCPKPGEGNTLLDELVEKLQPKYYFHGHHHVNYWDPGKSLYALGNFSKDKSSKIVINSLTKEMI
jgi:Icc-related predicted phosphoesterase